MVNFCAMVGCGSRGGRDKDKSFFRLPAIIRNQGEKTFELTSKRRNLWLFRISRDDLKESNLPYLRVCSSHFVSGKPASLYDQTNPDWAPCRKLGHEKFVSPTATVRYGRKKQRKQRAHEMNAASALLSLGAEEDKDTLSGHVTFKSSACQTDLTGQAIVEMQNELNRLVGENMRT